jgi:hypothetical protein
MRIPRDDDFGASDFLDSDEIKEVGDRIIRQKLAHLDDGELLIDYRWKRRGGTAGGNSTLGKCIKLTGLARHLSLGAHFCVWLAADHTRDRKFDDKQFEALVYHELCHIEREEPDEEDKPVIYRSIGHDAEVFFAELREYGAWRPSLQQLAETIRQLPLPMEEPVMA